MTLLDEKKVALGLLASISFSVFGMLLIFGLGFVFPTINPYIVIKWIIIVCAVVFVVSFLKFLVLTAMIMVAWKKERKVAKKTSKK